ncbi:MAG TPA: DUF1936 domain-containing protein [Planctomycetota bacterium]|jgi:hypothetical protein|nr:DUF1936 domain-containing protein [Planctomycetota bacterium]
MECPPCPLCNSGKLLPFFGESGETTAWVCSAPKCAYFVSNDQSLTFQKGVARGSPKETGETRYVEFEFGEED